MPVTPAEFRTAMRCLAGGVTIVTTREPDGRPTGLTASSFTSVSLSPPLVLVCVSHAATAYPAFAAHGWFAANLLRHDQEMLSRRFAQTGGDKFSGVGHRTGRTGLPLIEGALAALECRVIQQHEAGDHTIFVGEVEATTIAEGEPLLYFGGVYHALADAGGRARGGAA